MRIAILVCSVAALTAVGSGVSHADRVPNTPLYPDTSEGRSACNTQAFTLQHANATPGSTFTCRPDGRGSVYVDHSYR